MPLTCAFCKMEIQPGELVQPDVEMNLAHKTCADTELKKIDVKVAVVSGPGFGNPTASLEPCLMPSSPKVCCECSQPAISMCPYCKKYVHQDYGYNGANCSGRHEANCPGAADSRVKTKETQKTFEAPKYAKAQAFKGNGHKKNGSQRKGRR